MKDSPKLVLFPIITFYSFAAKFLNFELAFHCPPEKEVNIEELQNFLSVGAVFIAVFKEHCAERDAVYSHFQMEFCHKGRCPSRRQMELWHITISVSVSATHCLQGACQTATPEQNATPKHLAEGQ